MCSYLSKREAFLRYAYSMNKLQIADKESLLQDLCKLFDSSQMTTKVDQ